MSDTITGNDMEPDEVERRLGETLRAKAAQVVARPERFDIERPVVRELLAAPPRRSRRKLVALVTTVAIAAAAAGVVVLANRPRPGSTIVAGSQNDKPFPGPFLAPTWVPDGEQLWSVTPGFRSLHQPPVDTSDISVQLFGTMADRSSLATGVLLWLEHAVPGIDIGPGTPVTVRGQAGVARPTIDGGEAHTLIEWIESGADIQASVRGASVDQAVAAIDALRPRNGEDLLKGFDAAAEPGQYPLIGEQAQTDASSSEAELKYAAAAPVGDANPDFTVTSWQDNSRDSSYLRTLNGGRLAADGSAVESNRSNGHTVVTIAWPDGRQVDVVTTDLHSDLDVLEHIGSSAVLLDADATSALLDAANARVAALPLLGTAHLTSGDLELHGTGSASAVCLQVPGAAVACSDPFVAGLLKQDGTGGVLPGSASVVIDGQWYAFVGAQSRPSFTTFPSNLTSGAASATSSPRVIHVENAPHSAPLPVENAQIDGTYVALLSVPDGVDEFDASVSGHDGHGDSWGLPFTRPNL